MVSETEFEAVIDAQEGKEAETPVSTPVAEAEAGVHTETGAQLEAKAEPGEVPPQSSGTPSVEAPVGEQMAQGAQATQSAGAVNTAEPEAPAGPTGADGKPLVISLSEMTPEERHRATARLVFLAPDVPPVPPRQRRGSLRQLDDLLDERFSQDHEDRGRRRGGRGDRDRRDQRDDRNDRNDRDDRHDHGDRDDHESGDDRESGSSRRRNRRRSNGDSDDEGSRNKPQAQPITEPQKVKGSTRLEAKKQRRREGRDAGRRRRLVITESEFLARRESVDRQMVVRTTADRIQIGVLEDKVLVEHYVARSAESSMIGNVYLGRVQNVLPSMEAAFVDIGRGRNAVLYSGEVDWSEFAGSGNARRIENALKPGDLVLVQVTKDPVGHKGARLTSQISLPGRFLVYVPGGAMNGISRKLPDTERSRLKKILKEVLPTGAGVIVRTAAEGATEDQLTHDVQRLTKQWESIQKRVEQGTGPVMLHSEPDMLIKIVRDVFNEDFHKLVISGAETYETIENYVTQVAPELLERVERYEASRDLFDEYRVTEQIAKALDRKVWLPSGGSLVIDRTEAMTVVDVNTGKFVGSGGNLEETVTKNNLEAAEEIVRQLRLRDIGGIIVVDFIDMVLESNRDLVLRRLVECLSRDRTKHQVAEVTSLGLVQMTRKKLGLGLLESFSEPCEVCAGRGVVVYHEPVGKHRSEGGSRGKRKGNNSGQSQNSNGQAHAITDESRTMLAKIAASTIQVPAELGGDEHASEKHDAKAGSAGTGSAEPAAVSTKETKKQGPKRRRAARAAAPTEATAETHKSDDHGAASLVEDLVASIESNHSSTQKPDATVDSSPEALLGSVLDALPPAPEPGKRRRASRRVSTPSISATGTEGDKEKPE